MRNVQLTRSAIDGAASRYGPRYLLQLAILFKTEIVPGVEIDIELPEFVALRKHFRLQAQRQNKTQSGPGTELKKLLGRLGLADRVGCKCNSRAAEMDRQGVTWCENNINMIVDWLAEEAAIRKLPFVRLAGHAAVRLAIRRARKLKNDQTDAPAQAGNG